MKKILYKIPLFLFMLTLLSAIGQKVPAEENAGRYEILIMDDADLLTDEEEMWLYESMDELREYGNMIFSTVILSDWEDYERHSEDTYYEYFRNEPGVNFQIDMGNRKLTLSASTGMEKRIGSERDSIVDNIYKMASEGDYYSCAEECFHEIELILHDGKIAHTMKHIDNGILALIIGLILNFILIFADSKRKASNKKLLGAMAVTAVVHKTKVKEGKLSKIYSPQSSGGSGGGSSGGGGGGGFSGGSSSHGF